MPAIAVVGANWGDEGKGKIVDCLAASSDYVVRFQGGGNAGHTIFNDYGKFALHLLPSGVFHRRVVNVIGPGVALDLATLRAELEELATRGVPPPEIRISNRAQVVMPYHRAFDVFEEERLGETSFGSTRAGIAPFYADKSLKTGLRVADLFNQAQAGRQVDQALVPKNILSDRLYGKGGIESGAFLPELVSLAGHFRDRMCDTVGLLHRALENGQSVLLEGQLGALRDPDNGIHPFSTSSSPLAGFATVGAGIPPGAIEKIIAVVKAYSTCVGAGPFVTELAGSEARLLRAKGGSGGEYGATTGRPRRVGWFDGVATKYGCRLQGATEVALTNLDVLGYMSTIPICVAYRIDGAVTKDFPLTGDLKRAEPVLESLPGWGVDISEVRRLEDLPNEAQAYVARVEAIVEKPVRLISVGPGREAIIRAA